MGHINSISRSPCSTTSENDDSALSLTSAQLARLAKYRTTHSPLQKYQVGRVLGKGAFGVVRLLTDPKTGAQYACKQVGFCRVDGRGTDTIREEILREVESMCDLDHPGIASLKEYYESEEGICIVMERLRGEELSEAVLTRGSLAEEDARVIMRQLLEAVQYMHTQSVVHRDLKLENLVLQDEGDLSSVMIVDFGFACRAQSEARSPRMALCCGSPAFVAPDVVRAARVEGGYYGKECDVWSLGVILFVLLSGYFPFDGLTVHDILKRVLSANPRFDVDPVWELVSSEAKDLISGLLKADPTERLTVDAALRHEWLSEC
eukprot:jgi/Tetstr1/454486/TSEL_041386.t1